MALVPTGAGLFVVLAQQNFDQIGEAVKQKYPGGNLSLAPGQWFVAAPGTTTKEISDNLGITGDPTIGSAIVIAFSSYFGRANPQIWEWLNARLGGQRG